jgi:hypothetical protein
MAVALATRRAELEAGLTKPAMHPSRIAAWRATDDLDLLRDQLRH